jgi:Tfp pilus assembly protein PilN
LSNRIAWDLVLGHFAIILPDDVWLTSLNAAKPLSTIPLTSTSTTGAAVVASAGCGGSGLCINGYTYSQPSVARLLSRLAVVPAFTNVALSSSVETKLGPRKVYSFSIHADLTGQG